MDLYSGMIEKLMFAEVIQKTAEMDRTALIHDKRYHALEQIRAVLDDDTLDDPECFQRIEEIVLILESIGSGGGSRHDF